MIRSPVRNGARAMGSALTMVWIGASGCAPAPPLDGPAVAVETPRGRIAAGPSRSGSLRQDQISVRMSAGALRIEVTPLAGWVLEAAASDTRDRLTRIARTHGPALEQRTGQTEAVLFLVTFSSLQPGAEFRPDDLHLVSRGLRERPLAIQAITPGWGGHRVGQQESAVAVYAYSGSIDLSRDLTVWYQGEEDSSWSNIVSAVETERGRIPGAAGQSFSRPYFRTFR